MNAKETPQNVPVSIDTKRCKACDICASVCPAGVLAMAYDSTSTLGSKVSIISEETCIGCCDCELACPDFAISIASKHEFNFSKLTEEAKQKARILKDNNFRIKD
ncbi:MAG: 4Fe-4S dicluster domain-containing protein [Arcobacter sp.]|uniref:4Fe-4S dicluster domain-containing protein n=1 Tax=Arcobacter sp. TaxID=1872629 RepID=UPI003B005B51